MPSWIVAKVRVSASLERLEPRGRREVGTSTAKEEDFIVRQTSKNLVALAAIVLATLVFAIGQHILDLPQFARSVWANTLWTAAAAILTWQCLLTARHVEPPYYNTWRGFTLAAAAWLFGMLVWSWYELVLGRFTPVPSLADVGFLGYPILIVAAFLSMPTRHQIKYATLWKFATLLVFLSTVCFIYTILHFSEFAGTLEGNRLWIALAYPVLYFLAFIYACFLTLLRVGSRDFFVYLLISISLLLFSLVNLPYAYALINGVYLVGAYFDSLWIAALGTMIWAAWERRQIRFAEDELQENALSGVFWEAVVPGICGIAGILALFFALDQVQLAAAPFLTLFAIAYLIGASLQKYCLLRSEMRRALDAQLASEELQFNEARFRDLAELTADWFWETDLEQRFTYLTSSQVYEGAGLISQDWIGRSRWELHQHLTGEGLPEEVQGYMDRAEPFFDIRRRFHHPERGESWLSIAGKPLFDDAGQLCGYRGIGRNVTAEEQTKRKIREQQDLLRLVIDNVPATVYLKDLEGRYLLVNERLRGYLNLSDEEIEGRKTNELFTGHQAEEYEAQDREVIASRKIREFQSVAPWPDGEHHIHITKFPVFDAEGAFVAIGGINVDITEQRVLERQLRQAQRLEAVGQLTGGVAHDFNNLLAVILGNAELLSEGLEKQPELRQLSATIETAAERGSALTQRLLSFSRQQGLEPKAFDANELISGFEKLLNRTLGEEIEIERRSAAAPWPAYADPGQLENALLNLSINARDAMPGGGKLILETANVEIDEDYAEQDEELQPGRYVCIDVTDTGEGMPPEVAEKAFDPFFTTKEVGKGSGLGLSMVYGFLRQSGGFAKIYSETGLGTTIRLYLPTSESEKSIQDSPAVEPQAAPHGSETVLVVEDNEMVRGFVITQFGALGYRVLEAHDGPAALALLEGDTPVDLLFTDMAMPGGLHGYDVATEAVKLRPGLKVIFTTGFSDMTRFQLPRELADWPVLRKPYRRSELAQALRQLLDSK